MSTPGYTDNPGSLMPARLVFKCTDGGTGDGKFVEAVCTTSGQLVGSATNVAPRTGSLTSEPFPTGGPIVLAAGKCLLTTFSDSMTGLTGSFVIDSVSIADLSKANLDLDIYFGIGDLTTYRAMWNATPAAGNYGYLTTFTGGQHVSVVKIRSTDYTTGYSAAATPAVSFATKLCAHGFPIASGTSPRLHCVVIYAGTSTATLAQYAVNIEATIRLGG